MTIRMRGPGPLCLAALAAAFLAAQPVRAETLASTNADSRLLVAFDVPDAALAEALPPGWSSAPFGGGALAGADMVMVFVDSHEYRDPEGKPKHGGRYRGLAMAAPARADGSEKTVFMVTHVYISDAAINPYKNSVGSRVTREVVSTGSGSDAAATRESWSVAPETGGRLAVSLEWGAGVPGRSQAESLVHSAVEPDFFRIYRYDQYVDLVMSGPAQVDRTESLAVDVAIPELAALFDGSERLVGVLSVPWYMREVWLP